ncbi:DVUA0089 family protein [Oceanicella actignis]|uniref:VPLPA-CTERM protein sorting domain-containing protein n=1 Tax=Oceanicella actignis TaxID=1189325 RepID=A0A1M7STH1_9RHOB|nr:DVUA0089 family protein [Oceanicella actignis]SES70175.1 VPLPA-CTERM protein sorting domain-containing protein [Oceanicella actignis]SHN61805.1 VPLPA-CTERM protein sorting domain-containing protein [Oceanicella actignis]
MIFDRIKGVVAAAGFMAGLAAAPAMAVTVTPVFTATGTFAADDGVALFQLTLDASGSVDLRTFGYAGGTMEDGTSVPAGGFDPALWLFAADGSFLTGNDDGAGVGSDPVTGQPYDARISGPLGAGTYFLALTQYQNTPLAATDPGKTLADGFTYDGQPHYTATLQAGFCDPTSFFCDSWVVDGKSVLRTGDYAVQAKGVSSFTPLSDPSPSPVPLPAGLPLLLGAFAGLAALGRRRS